MRYTNWRARAVVFLLIAVLMSQIAAAHAPTNVFAQSTATGILAGMIRLEDGWTGYPPEPDRIYIRVFDSSNSAQVLSNYYDRGSDYIDGILFYETYDALPYGTYRVQFEGIYIPGSGNTGTWGPADYNNQGSYTITLSTPRLAGVNGILPYNADTSPSSTIQGRVIDAATGQGIAGIAVWSWYEDGAITDVNGYYTMTVSSIATQEYQITPTSPNYSFSPASRTFDVPPSQTNQNFTATRLSSDCARFVADANYPDGSRVAPSQVFEKRWRIQNCGSATWGSSYQAVRTAGAFGPAAFAVSAAPNAEALLSAFFTAPSNPGTYRATYRLQGPNGLFGDSFWVEVVVQQTTGGGYIIFGRVVDINGDPISAATVSLDSSGLTAVSNANGDYQISGLASGIYNIRATHSIYRFPWSPVTVRINNQNVTPADLTGVRGPLILIPGIMGSYLDQPGGLGTCNLWPGLPRVDCPELKSKNPALKLPPPDGSAPIYATYAHDTYNTLLSLLVNGRSHGGAGYKETGSRDETPLQRCQQSADQAASLYVFAYDWRQDIDIIADDLAKLITCVRNKHGGSDVDILTHSMGGLVARRYIVEQKEQSHVGKLITVAAPWLGAPRAIPIMTTGWYEPIINAILNPVDLKAIAATMPGVWQLAPSPYYYDLIARTERPLTEDGRDLDGDLFPQGWFDELDYAQTMLWLEKETQASTYGLRYNMGFHTAVQDDFRTTGYGIRYTHFYGIRTSEDTVEGLTAGWKPGCIKFDNPFLLQCSPIAGFEPRYTFGDGTVPVVSASRQGQGKDLNAPGSRVEYILGPVHGDTGHTQLVSNENVLMRILQELNSTMSTAAIQTTSQPAITPESAIYLNILGSGSVTIADAAGNTTDAISGTLTTPIPDITYVALTDQQHVAVLRSDQAYTVTIKAGSIPIMINLRRGTSHATELATRFLDVSVAPNTTLQLRITPQGIAALTADTDDDGSFETLITPSADLTGAAAADSNPPALTITATGVLEAKTITISASDPGSGVKQLLYSLDGTTFLRYTGPFVVSALQAPSITAFADDHAANRSTLTTAQLLYQINLPISVR
jgi:pimeloyl-ACP methyl ester carboxylesterase